MQLHTCPGGQCQGVQVRNSSFPVFISRQTPHHTPYSVILRREPKNLPIFYELHSHTRSITLDLSTYAIINLYFPLFTSNSLYR